MARINYIFLSKWFVLGCCSFSLLIIHGCSTTSSPQQNPGVVILGSWTWLETSGGIGGMRFYPKNGDNEKILFSSDGRFYQYRNDTLEETAQYTITHINKSGVLVDSLIWELSVTNRQLNHSGPVSYIDTLSYLKAIEFIRDSLLLVDEMSDGYLSVYQKSH
jgi:hypothetical protein